MDYKRIYDALIDRAKNRLLEGYSESHHIIPKCMGGTDDSENLCNLTAEEHFVAHQLLVKIYPKNPGLIYAAKMMTIGNDGQGNRKGNKLYGWLRRRFSKTVSEARKGVSLSEEHKKSLSIAARKRAPRKRSQEEKDKISAGNKGKPKSDAHRAALSLAAKNRKSNPKRSAEAKKKMSAAQKIAVPLRDESYKYTDEYKALQSKRGKEAWVVRKQLKQK